VESTHRTVACAPAHAGQSVLAVLPVSRERVLSHGRDGFVRLWDVTNALRTVVSEVTVPTSGFCPAALQTMGNGPDGASADVPADAANRPRMVALPGADAQAVTLWDVREPSIVQTLHASSTLGPSGMCMCLRFGSADALLAGWEDGSLELFDLRAGRSRARAKIHSEPLLCMDVDVCAKFALTGAADRRLCLTPLDLASTSSETTDARCLGEPETATLPVTNEASGSGGIAALCLRPDRRIFASGGWDKRIRIWQRRNLKPLAVIHHHTGTVNAVHFSTCSRWLLSGSEDRTLALWSLYSGEGEIRDGG